MSLPWTLLLPIRLAAPKKRLSHLTAGEREQLAVAMATDVAEAAHACADVAEVILVADPAARDALPDWTHVLDDGSGLNAALTRAARGRRQIAALLPDVPAVRPEDLSWALSRAAKHARTFVADASGIGTTMVTSLLGDDLRPSFGCRSCAAHLASGAVPIIDDVPGRLARMRCDVDDEIGLWEAKRLGVGPHTFAVTAST